MYQMQNNENLFAPGEVYPAESHYERIKLYRKNRKIFKGLHREIFHTAPNNHDAVYVSANIGSLVCKKSADFLFGETMKVLAMNGNNTPEQQAFDRFVEENHLNILLYENALSNAYNGDSFIRVRFGQSQGGLLPHELDPARVIIENIDAERVYPETAPWDRSLIVKYHVTTPYYIEKEKQWYLAVETHEAGKITHTTYKMEVNYYDYSGEPLRWSITEQLDTMFVEQTGVPVPLVVHIPNMSVAGDWRGVDELVELHPLLEEINLRLTQISDILTKHADPAMVVPTGLISEDAEGNTSFNVQFNKVFEMLGKDDVVPSYLTWDGQLASAYNELDRLIDLVLMTAEIPGVVLGRSNSGTSGNSGLSVRLMMNSILSKTNRKRQYYAKGLKQVFYIAQKLEEVVGIADYEITIPTLEFNDGLPIDHMEQTQIAQLLVNSSLQSRKTAIMRLNDFTEEQAELEMERIAEEQATSVADASIFNFAEEPDPEPLADFMSEETEDIPEEATI